MSRRCPRLYAWFLGTEGALYLWFLEWDISGRGSTRWLKYAAIVLCFLFAAGQALRGGNCLITAALGCTVAADAFLLVADRCYPLGITFFCAAHLLYRGSIERGREYLCWHVVFLAFGVGVLLAAAQGSVTDGMAGFYACLLVSNAVCAGRKKNQRKRLLFMGLCLLMCCDLCVAIHNLPGLFAEQVYSFTEIGMWLFYLPSQVLVALSAAKGAVQERNDEKE